MTFLCTQELTSTNTEATFRWLTYTTNERGLLYGGNLLTSRRGGEPTVESLILTLKSFRVRIVYTGRRDRGTKRRLESHRRLLQRTRYESGQSERQEKSALHEKADDCTAVVRPRFDPKEYSSVTIVTFGILCWIRRFARGEFIYCPRKAFDVSLEYILLCFLVVAEERHCVRHHPNASAAAVEVGKAPVAILVARHQANVLLDWPERHRVQPTTHFTCKYKRNRSITCKCTQNGWINWNVDKIKVSFRKYT